MGPATLLCFEFCDLLISITVLLYIGNTAVSAASMHVTQRVRPTRAPHHHPPRAFHLSILFEQQCSRPDGVLTACARLPRCGTASRSSRWALSARR